MNLETLASPPGAGDVSAAGACSLTSLLSISCRSRAEAAQSFAKKLHNKLWFFGPSLSSADGQFSSSRLSGEGGEEEELGVNWPVAVETRLDLSNNRVETVVTSVPRVLSIPQKKININHPPLLTCNAFSQQVPRPTVAASYLVMEPGNNAADMDTATCQHLSPMSDWISSYRNENQVNGDEPASSVSSGVSHDLESDTSSVTYPHSDSDQYFDFGADTPQDDNSVDSAGEETISQETPIVINHDDGLPIQPESGCIFGSPVASEDEHEHDEEESSIYESLSQSPAAMSYFFKVNHDRHFFNNLEPVRNVSAAANLNTPDALSAPFVQKPVEDSNSEAHAQSQPLDNSARVECSNPRSQGDLEGTRVGDVANYSPSGPFGKTNDSHQPRLVPICNQNGDCQQSAKSSGHDENDGVDSAVSDLVILSNNSSPAMVQHDPVIIELNRATDSVRSLQLDLLKDVEATEPARSGSACNDVVLSTAPSDVGSATAAATDDVAQPQVTAKAENEDDIDDEENMVNRHRVQRSTSLKTGKTPPGTPGSKKIVRFADALGLDLAAVRTFLDEVPNVPQSAFNDLSGVEVSNTPAAIASSFPWRASATTFSRMANTNPLSLVASFTQPGNLPNFLELVKQQKICLETACLVDDSCLSGVVRVLNIDFHKSVLVRYTMDEWKTHSDQLATYVPGSCDGLSDRFTFSIPCAQSLQVGQRFIFALCYRVSGQEIWDSNTGKNYVFQCISNSNFMPSIALNSSLSPSDSFSLPYM